ncbi:hypothetical protein [Fischerella sp. PCC 9605]|uniref:hypothetical protein n=1 Tax=Fischerella sp. PCC 9605 TaxID=1173024 RepID=UPI00047B2385|nr:hypothetical protein [Fischerella sp. PCC 9605]
MTNDFKKEESGKQQTSVTKHQTFWEKYGGAPLGFIMRNPRITPIALLILATVPKRGYCFYFDAVFL